MKKSWLEKIVRLPAEALEKGAEETKKAEQALAKKKPFKLAKRYWHTLGPGLTTGASDDDPSGIATYSQTGAKYGFQLLWLSLFTFPLMSVVQEMCARIGLVTGQGLAANIRHHYPKWVLYTCTVLLVVANSFNIGADLGAMAKVVQLLQPQFSFALLVVVFALVSLLLQIFTPYGRYAHYLKYLALVLGAYILVAFLVDLDWSEVIKYTFIPSLSWSRDQLFLVCAIFGTTISPYLFFWQTSQEVEEQILHGEKTIQERKRHTTPHEIRRMRIDVWSGMFVSNIVMFFIIAACAATLFANGQRDIATAADAALALRPFAGDAAYLLFALGIVGTGMLAIPVLAGSASYAVSESLGWKNGLYRKLKEAYAFYGVIIISMMIGLGLNFVGLDPIKALIYSAVANGIVAPVVLILIVGLSSNKHVMGESVNHPVVTLIGWLTVFLMAAAGIAVIVSFFW